jgi:hypothetical protein
MAAASPRARFGDPPMAVDLQSLRKGSRFGAVMPSDDATPDAVALYCIVERIHGNDLVCRVINGAWGIRFDAETGVSRAGYVPAGFYQIAYTESLPSGLDLEDYNAVIEYMNEQLGVTRRCQLRA